MSTQKKMHLARLMAVATLSLVLLSAADAQADVRVRARLETPVGVIHVSNQPSVRYRELPPRPVLLGDCVQMRLTKQDHRIARRLARYTGVSRHRLLELKRDGYTWNQIGRWLDLSPRVVRAASGARSWERFLDSRHEVVRYCEDDRHHGRGRGHGHHRH